MRSAGPPEITRTVIVSPSETVTSDYKGTLREVGCSTP